jgi:hypothetical protein
MHKKLLTNSCGLCGLFVVVFPLFLTILLPLLNSNNGVRRNGRYGFNPLLVGANTSVVTIRYTHPRYGDRAVMVGDRMLSHVPDTFLGLFNEWQKPRSGRTGTDLEELIAKRT